MSSSDTISSRVAVILSGGGSSRMQGVDKAVVELSGCRLIDRVASSLEKQVDEILISGSVAYNTVYPVIPDQTEGPKGPTAGLWATSKWLQHNRPSVQGFLSVPVDGPFLPTSLFETLYSDDGNAYACDDSGSHPTFAYWNIKAVQTVLNNLPEGRGISLHALAKQCEARQEKFPGGQSFLNVNTREDLRNAEQMLDQQAHP